MRFIGWKFLAVPFLLSFSLLFSSVFANTWSVDNTIFLSPCEIPNSSDATNAAPPNSNDPGLAICNHSEVQIVNSLEDSLFALFEISADFSISTFDLTFNGYGVNFPSNVDTDLLGLGLNSFEFELSDFSEEPAVLRLELYSNTGSTLVYEAIVEVREGLTEGLGSDDGVETGNAGDGGSDLNGSGVPGLGIQFAAAGCAQEADSSSSPLILVFTLLLICGLWRAGRAVN